MKPPLVPGDMLWVTMSHGLLWANLRNDNMQHKRLPQYTLVMLVARCPGDPDWWAPREVTSTRDWRNELLFVVTACGDHGWIMREQVAVLP